MGRKLNTSVLHDGVVYEAGTDESDIRNADAITADVWGDSDGSTAATSSLDNEELAKAAKALEAANATIEELKARVAELEAAAGDGDDEKGPYDGMDVDALKAEIDKRNDGRDKDSRIDKRGGEDTLRAALVADDEAQES